jgi:hypothetical protein
MSFVAKTLTAPDGEAHARAAVERLAQLATAAALAESAPGEVAAAFARARLAQSRGAIYGTANLDSGEATQMLERALPSG